MINIQLKKGTWSENLREAILALLSAVPLGYVAIVYFDHLIFSIARLFYVAP